MAKIASLHSELSPWSLLVIAFFKRPCETLGRLAASPLATTTTAATAAANLVNLKWRQIEASGFYCGSLRRLPSSLCVYQSSLMDTDDTEANSVLWGVVMAGWCSGTNGGAHCHCGCELQTVGKWDKQPVAVTVALRRSRETFIAARSGCLQHSRLPFTPTVPH